MTIENYVKELETKNNERLHAQGNDIVRYVFGVEYGKKYARIWHADRTQDGSEPKYKSVFCFVDENGNIYKPAGWKAPAKGIRATLENPIYFMHELYKTYRY